MAQMTDKQKKNVATGAAAVVGAAAGVAGATFIPTDADAAEVENPQDDAQVVDAEPQQSPQSGASHSTHSSSSHTASASNASHSEPEAEVVDHVSNGPDNQTHTQENPTEEHDSNPTPNPTPDPQPTPTPGNDGEPEVTVLGSEVVTAEDGSQAEVAAVSADGQTVVIADTTMDGYANIAATDVNGNGQIDDNEIVDVTGQGISMQPFRDGSEMVDTNQPVDDTTVQPDNTLASADEPDYINDGNVDDFMA